MGGIYFHIPFCRKACHYCDFHFSTNLLKKSDLVAGLAKELVLRKDFFSSEQAEISTVYWGGGTPSLLSGNELAMLVRSLHDIFPKVNDDEWTLEANPEDIDAENLSIWKANGINRLSIGVQSFADGDLVKINRNHSGQQAESSIKLAQDKGFERLSIDLMFGLPSQTVEDWVKNIEKVISLKVPHISVYALTVEEKTALHYQLKQKLVCIPEEEVFDEQYIKAHQLLEAAGYEHYEISNYALNGAFAQHNTSYWNGKPYLGIGPSAHSFNDGTRSWNVKNNARYLQNLKKGILPIESTESLSLRDEYNEYIMTHFRQRKGIKLSNVLERYQINIPDRFPLEWSKWKNLGLLIEENGHCYISPEGWFLSDQIVSDFFLD